MKAFASGLAILIYVGIILTLGVLWVYPDLVKMGLFN